MTLEELARTVLFGTRIEDKLAKVELTYPESKLHTPIEIPNLPGRPAGLRKGKAAFPSIHQLNDPIERARVLHFFANHELLALELMALMLLRFPTAPLAFRKGVAAILMQEQDHLALYLARMHELGIEFGDLPVNNYFWNALKTMKSPMDFTVQMSLTFEQANLDFSLYFKNLIEKTGDTATTAILERVFQEEIAHVKHGVHWFNRWRRESEAQLPKGVGDSDWEAYLKLLPSPLTPQRAKGFEFSAPARRQAGLSEKFIRELGVYTGSKGRPPTIWLYNPQCDSEIARGKVGFTPTQGALQLSRDLEAVPVFLCKPQDTVLVHEKPNTDYLEKLQQWGFKIPEFVLRQQAGIAASISSPKVGGLDPWGWSPEVFEDFKPLLPRLVPTTGGNFEFCSALLSKASFEETGLGPLFSKAWSCEFLAQWLRAHPESAFCAQMGSAVGKVCKDWNEAEAQILEILQTGASVMAKAPYGTSGMQLKKIETHTPANTESAQNPQDPKIGWLQNIIQKQGAIVVEPYLDKIADFSVQLEILEERIRVLDIRRFLTGPQHEYRGTYLADVAPKLSPKLSKEERRAFFSLLPEWRGFLRDLGGYLRTLGYRGPAGVDALLWRNQQGQVCFKPMIELNPRWTMGRVALNLEKHLLPGVLGIWRYVSVKEILRLGFKSPLEYAEDLQLKHPPVFKKVGGTLRLASGVLFTNDPSQARSVLTVLGVLGQPSSNAELDLHSHLGLGGAEF